MLIKNHTLKENEPVDTRPRNNMKGKSWTIGLTGLFFILLQSACTAFMALSGLRLLIGLGSLAAATAGTNLLASIHSAAIRIPMEIFAIAGSVINLYAIWRVRSLRARPSSQWRVAPVSADKRRAESIQIAIALSPCCWWRLNGRSTSICTIPSSQHPHWVGWLVSHLFGYSILQIEVHRGGVLDPPRITLRF